ncbi:MAG: hypothetical protein RXQ97_00930 [Caldivirga sp.]
MVKPALWSEVTPIHGISLRGFINSNTTGLFSNPMINGVIIKTPE